MLRLICMSDTHSLHRRVTVPPGDVLIHAGDLTGHGELDELRDLNDWLGTLPHAHKQGLAPQQRRCKSEVNERWGPTVNTRTHPSGRREASVATCWHRASKSWHNCRSLKGRSSTQI